MKKILYVTSECLPFASSGGLADVAGSLPEAIRKAYGTKVDIRVVMPLYGRIGDEWRSQMEFIGYFYVDLAWRHQYCGLFKLVKNKVTYYFLDNEYYFKRASLYGDFDDGERFAFFSKAVMDMMPYTGFFPDILHANDWETALTVIYLKYRFGLCEGYSGIKAVFTIHNIAYQGMYSGALLGDLFGLDESVRSVVEYNGCINLMKGAIVAADIVSTVSETYAEEILSPRYSYGLHFILLENRYKLTGILNGIDYVYYNPQKDKTIKAVYSAEDMSGKAICKEEIQKEMGLPVNPNVPVVSVISRLVDLKGLDLITMAAEDILSCGIQLIVLGTGDRYYEDFFRSLAYRHPDCCAVRICYDKDMSKRVYSGSDMFLMPSKTEPCGLSQMIAAHYGAVPLVRGTGGLYDSIKDITTGGIGFNFMPYSAWDLLCTVRRATSMYYNDKCGWKTLSENAMKYDFSWKKSAGEYMERLYK